MHKFGHGAIHYPSIHHKRMTFREHFQGQERKACSPTLFPPENPEPELVDMVLKEDLILE